MTVFMYESVYGLCVYVHAYMYTTTHNVYCNLYLYIVDICTFNTDGYIDIMSNIYLKNLSRAEPMVSSFQSIIRTKATDMPILLKIKSWTKKQTDLYKEMARKQDFLETSYILQKYIRPTADYIFCVKKLEHNKPFITYYKSRNFCTCIIFLCSEN